MVTAPSSGLVMPPIFDELWDEHGPRIQAATLAAVEAQAEVAGVMTALQDTPAVLFPEQMVQP